MDERTQEERIVRIDERVEMILNTLPGVIATVKEHDRDILTAKIIAVAGIVLIAVKFPAIAEVVTSVMK